MTSSLVSPASQLNHSPPLLLCLHLLKCDTFLYLLWGQYGCSSPSTKVLYGRGGSHNDQYDPMEE